MDELVKNNTRVTFMLLPAGVVLGIVVLLSVLLVWRPPREFTIATGREGGAYYAFAQEYQQRLAALGYTLRIRETAGAIETLELLNAGEVDVGFVQNTVSPGIANPDLSTLAAVYYEALWIFYRDDLNPPPENVAELAGLRINIGEVGSATNATNLSLLELNGVTPENAILSMLPTREAAQQLKDGELDVLMTLAGAAAPQEIELMNTPGIRLLPLERAAAYASRFKNLTRVTLPEGVISLSDNIPPQDTPMIAARATLVTTDDLHPDLARLLLIVADDVHRSGGIFEAPNEFPSSTLVGIPMNADAARYLANGPTELEQYLPLWLASRLERFIFIFLPVSIILYSVLKGIPALTNSVSEYRIKRRYNELRTIERSYTTYDRLQLQNAIVHLETSREDIVQQSLIPTHLMSDLYDVQYHTERVIERLRSRLVMLDETG